ncbi:alpha/beta fold hydrolase [Arthrobacter nitrophenolicus]|uniref:Pimeloyl-ACP methyl ester carboxylesterase n=2 Tax=Arthrobacter nitrophenolicus TaxID=683150 RepID=A0ACC6TL96_9MICC|nr:alpha/beta hydrolase [Arthrobacter nitrophenolicus]ELT42776.1 hydrolase [Arthrobacter nitrophenolicus]
MSLYPDLKEGTVVVDGIDVRFYDSQRGNGEPPVVLLHGMEGSAEKDFWALFPMLAFTRRVITFDFGLPKDGQDLTLEHCVAQAQAVIEKLAPGSPVALVGYSFGAVVAEATAARKPDLVASLVLIAGWMKTDRHQLVRNGIWRELAQSGSSALSDFNLYSSYSAHYLCARTERDFQEIVEKSRRSSISPVVIKLSDNIDIGAEVQTISAPTLVVGCIHDQIVDVSHSRELFGAIRDSRYVEIEAGHAVVQERPAELFMLIDNFVAAPHATSPGDVYATSTP